MQSVNNRKTSTHEIEMEQNDSKLSFRLWLSYFTFQSEMCIKSKSKKQKEGRWKDKIEISMQTMGLYVCVIHLSTLELSKITATPKLFVHITEYNE